MQGEIEMPRLKQRDTTNDLLKKSLIEYQTILIEKIEENRKCRQVINSNNEDIEALNKNIEYLEDALRKKTR